MPTRSLRKTEWTLRSVSSTHQVFIDACTNPRAHDDVNVLCRPTYSDGTEGNFNDNVNIDAGGEADHATSIGKKAVNEAKTIVTVEWQT